MPGDHIEIQWRGNTRVPYETLVVEFKQYPQRSSMRRAKLPRHTEDSAGNYGGIRKLHSQEEIQKWNQLLDRQQYI
ncbi:hypothetical protein P8452_66248 [Trifolium repens]|nr:hypothetical protein P8452_66248 [Trifolium repens]